MCGIAGLYRLPASRSSVQAAARAVEAMTASLAHRGPDDEGIWSDPGGRCVLGNRRLSIIDVSAAGHQPIASVDGRWLLTVNGEIYNFVELRRELAARGIEPRGGSDSEVLVNAVALWGYEALPRLDGMFAFAAFDTWSGALLLARDPFGEKPLYYSAESGELVFASELRAFERLPGFDPEVSLEAIAELLMFEYIGAPRSIYRAVHKLPPGHYLHAQPDGTLRIARYFAFDPGAEGFDDRPLPVLADELHELLVRSLRRRVIADVPLGAFLSGGIDSATVCALARDELGLPLETFSIGFAGAPESEHETARAAAAHLGLPNRQRILAPEAVGALATLGGLLDEPIADWSALPVYLLSQLARERVTVALSGDGGDELFGGYDRYFATADGERTAGARYYDWGLLAAGEAAVAELIGAVPRALGEHLRRLRAEIDEPGTPLLCRVRRSDVENYLPGAVLAKVDRMSMATSLEVRTPFLSVELARFAARLPPAALWQAGRGKPVLREIAYRYLPRPLIDRPKSGFGLPSSDWARAEIGAVARRLLLDDDSRVAQVCDRTALAALLERPRAVHRWWGLAILESWARHHRARLPEAGRGRRATPPLAAALPPATDGA